MIPLSCKLFKLPIGSEYFCNLRMYCICMCCVWGPGVIFTLSYVIVSGVIDYVSGLIHGPFILVVYL